MDQEIMLRAELLRKNIEETEQRIEFIDEQISELQTFSSGIIFIEENGENEMLASIGKGIYVKSEMKSKNFLVDVGAGILVKKDINQTKRIIDNQISRLGEMRQQMNSYLVTFNKDFESLVEEINRSH